MESSKRKIPEPLIAKKAKLKNNIEFTVFKKISTLALEKPKEVRTLKRAIDRGFDSFDLFFTLGYQIKLFNVRCSLTIIDAACIV